MERLISLSGLLVMVALAFAMGADRRKVDLRLVAAGVGMQFLLALLVLFYARAQPPLGVRRRPVAFLRKLVTVAASSIPHCKSISRHQERMSIPRGNPA